MDHTHFLSAILLNLEQYKLKKTGCAVNRHSIKGNARVYK